MIFSRMSSLAARVARMIKLSSVEFYEKKETETVRLKWIVLAKN